MGDGAKTVIPSKAHAKISMRLVPDQDWEEISELFSNHFKSLAPKRVNVEVITHHGGYAYVFRLLDIKLHTKHIKKLLELHLYLKEVGEVYCSYV